MCTGAGTVVCNAAATAGAGAGAGRVFSAAVVFKEREAPAAAA